MLSTASTVSVRLESDSRKPFFGGRSGEYRIEDGDASQMLRMAMAIHAMPRGLRAVCRRRECAAMLRESRMPMASAVITPTRISFGPGPMVFISSTRRAS